ALVGAVYASGGLQDFKEAVLKLDRKKVISMLDLVFPKCGLLDGKKVTDFFQPFVSKDDFRHLSIPMAVTATDLHTSREAWLMRGSVIQAVRASIAVPGLFTPVLVNDRLMVDGGLVNPLPVNLVRSMGADVVIAVDLNHYMNMRGSSMSGQAESGAKLCPEDESGTKSDLNEEKNGIFPGIMDRLGRMDIPWFDSFKNWKNKPVGPNIFEIIFASTLVMEKTITDLNLEREPADLLVRPNLGKVRFMDFHRAKESIAQGAQACARVLEDNGSILDRLTSRLLPEA
ncbi:MAG: patatin-like phospholipase family protein, partial [Desulfonatronovibrionaceae bacterium]